MKRLLLFILAVLFVVTSVSAAEEVSISSKWVFSEQSIQVNNQVFIVTLIRNADRIVVRFDNNYMDLELNECETEDYTKVCFEDREYDTSKKLYKAKVNIYSIYLYLIQIQINT